MVFYFGGIVGRADGSRRDDFREKKSGFKGFYTNDLYRFDPLSKDFLRVLTKVSETLMVLCRFVSV